MNRIPRSVRIAVVAIVLVAVGWFAKSAYDHMQLNQAKKAATAYIGDLTSGDVAAAYRASSGNITKKQTEAQFKTAVGNVTSSKPELQKAQALEGDGVVYYTQAANNLPKSAEGGTSGAFVLSLKKSGMNWQVDSVTIL